MALTPKQAKRARKKANKAKGWPEDTTKTSKDTTESDAAAARTLLTRLKKANPGKKSDG